MKLKDLLREAGGEKPGKLEVVSTPAPVALEHLKSETDTTGEDWQAFLKAFEGNYMMLQSLVAKGKTQRRNMPVVGSKQVEELRRRLEHGELDIIDHTTGRFHKRFEQGLTGKEADEWLVHGLHDGHATDDITKVKIERRPVGSLTPIQQQIYAEIPIDMVVKRGVDGAYKYISAETLVIVSKDEYLLDGHHRWAAGVLLDPKLTVRCMVIDIKRDELLQILLSYGDAIGNPRNG